MNGMVKIKLLGQGYASFTGLFGDVEFEDAVSNWIPPRVADRIAAILSVEKVAGDALMQEEKARLMRMESMSVATEVSADEPAKDVIPAEGEVTLAFSREELGKIADKHGINGLREIGDRYDVKGKAISELINKIIEAQLG